jgi:hypothetical protein
LANGKVDSLSDLGVTATAAELNYMGGVTSNVQTQLDGKLSTSGGTISGVITTTDGDAFNRNVTTSGTYYYGGTGFDDGAFLGLYGKDQSNYAGEFRLKADNGEIINNMWYCIMSEEDPYELYFGQELVAKRGELESPGFPYTFPLTF